MDLNNNMKSYKEVIVPVSINGVNYKICEASGKSAAAYRDAMVPDGVELHPDGSPKSLSSLKGVSDRANKLLICLCVVDSDGSNVHETVVEGWPDRAVRYVSDTIKEISEFPEFLAQKRAQEAAERKLNNPEAQLEDNPT